jgi:hypothetical protein
MSLLLLLRTLLTPAPAIPPGRRSVLARPRRRRAVVIDGRTAEIGSAHRTVHPRTGRAVRVEVHHRTTRPV